jgi:hypothetical protein
MRLVTTLTCCLVYSVSLAAQWPAFLRPDVPKTPAGAPDLSAPAPRLPGGTPDLSGVWESRIPPSGRLGGPMIPNLGDGPPVATFVNAGRNMQGGLPYTPWAAELRKQRQSTFSTDNPDANCLPIGFMQQHTHSQPRKIIQTRDDLMIAYEANGGLRHILLDGRPLPANDPQPWWQGYSVGRWEGDTLVVQSMGFRDDGWLDVDGSYFGTTTRITERFRRVSYGRLDIEVTVDDPKAYSRPWTVTLNQDLAVDTELLDYHCTDNEKARLVGQ